MEETKAITDGWNAVIHQSALTPAGVERAFDLPMYQLGRWLDGRVKPSKKSIDKMEPIMQKLRDNPRIPYSPIWGYAKPEQIERLKQPIPPHERDAIMKQIEKQTRLKGKID